MRGHEFLRRLQRLGRERGVIVRVDAGRGKGSHGRLYFGSRSATLIDRKKEIGPKLLSEMCRQLAIKPSDL